MGEPVPQSDQGKHGKTDSLCVREHIWKFNNQIIPNFGINEFIIFKVFNFIIKKIIYTEMHYISRSVDIHHIWYDSVLIYTVIV